MSKFWISAILIAGFLNDGHLHADTITIPGTVVRTPGLGPQVFVKINMKNAAGNPVTINSVLVDTGDNDGITFGAGDAKTAGLAAGAATPVAGNGGEAVANDTNIPAAQAGSFDGEKDSNSHFTAPVTGAAHIDPGSNQTTVGTSYFNTDPAGSGAVFINYATGTVIIYNHIQALAIELENAFRTQMIVVPDGTFDIDSIGSAYAVNVDVSNDATSTIAPFVIASGETTTLISADLASSLGASCTGPNITDTTQLGTFTIPTATLSLNVFAAQGSVPLQVGCLPNSLNPNHINTLGSDFLGTFDDIGLNEATLTFSATPVPEPSTLSDLSGVLLVMAFLRSKRRH
jgi:hypothetical protein